MSISSSLITYGVAALAVSGAIWGVKAHLDNDNERKSYVAALENGIKIKADADAASLAEAKRLLAAAEADAALKQAGIERLLELAGEKAPPKTCSAAVRSVQELLR